MYARMDAQRVRDLPRLLLVHPDGSPGDGPRCFWSACGRSASPRSDDSEHRACLAGGASPASVGDPVQTDGGDAGTLAWPPWRDVVDRRPLPPPPRGQTASTPRRNRRLRHNVLSTALVIRTGRRGSRHNNYHELWSQPVNPTSARTGDASWLSALQPILEPSRHLSVSPST